MKHENITSIYWLPLLEIIIKSGDDEQNPSIDIKACLIVGSGCYSKKSRRHFKLHPLSSRLHLNLGMPLQGNNPWLISTFNVFCFPNTIWSNASKCSNNNWLIHSSSTSSFWTQQISFSKSIFDNSFSVIDVGGVYQMLLGEHPTWIGLKKCWKPPTTIPFKAPQ
jgi:hypothetical protein